MNADSRLNGLSRYNLLDFKSSYFKTNIRLVELKRKVLPAEGVRSKEDG